MRVCLAFALGLFCLPNVGATQHLTVLSRTELRSGLASFGGFSGIEARDEGAVVHILTDRGVVFDLALRRDPDHTITGYTITGQQNVPLADPEFENDTEGLALASDGTLWVSFETPPHVAKLASQVQTAPSIVVFEQTSGQRVNRGLEALAIDRADRLIAIAEETAPGTDDFPVYRFEQGAWVQIASLPAAGSFLVTGADVGPDGRLYVLERAFSLIGMRSRIRVIDLLSDAEPSEVVFESRHGAFGNLEGIDVWRDQTGLIRILMVSDNNYLGVMRSELVEIALHSALAHGIVSR